MHRDSAPEDPSLFTAHCYGKADQVDLKAATIFIRRRKGSTSGAHPLRRAEVAALKKLEGDRRGLVLRSERGAGVSDSVFRKIVARAGEAAGFGFPVHPHMLRHGCGYRPTSAGHDTRAIQAWLGHQNIQHTVRYTELAPRPVPAAEVLGRLIDPVNRSSRSGVMT
jgi:type 1 fimbriae regulatory protein FimB/type 1 fimbriae regulatory protein FimE